MRGEYFTQFTEDCFRKELPPRARRIPYPNGITGKEWGTTSACAENTKLIMLANPFNRNYLRVRGEYNQVVGCLIYCWELPPRARRIP